MQSTRTLRKTTRQSSQTQNQISSDVTMQSPGASASATTEKENRANGNGHVTVVKQEPEAKPRAGPAGAAGHGRASSKKIYCSCRQPDDGSPMILCSECKEWYHFRCLNLDERDAEDIQLFVCSTCHEKTGLSSVMEWEGPDALEERKEVKAGRKSATPAPSVPVHKRSTVYVELEQRRVKGKGRAAADAEETVNAKAKGTVKKEPQPTDEEKEESSEDGSEDEYVAENKSRTKAKVRGKRRAISTDSDSETDGDKRDKKTKSTRKLRRPSTASATAASQRTRTRTLSASTSPPPSPTQSRRRKSSATTLPPPKRKRTNTMFSQSQAGTSGAGTEDAARKYCLTKLQEIFCQIFLRYPVLRPEGEEMAEADSEPVDKKPEELTDEEKTMLEERAKQFATDLEECMYEIYAEPDKTGKHSVAAKYKECFRMLSFNLSKPDRVILHKRIAGSHITPRELSMMSSTDLANEETKLSIRQAEKEALQHSILKKTLLPRAKITHKGLQDIEDVNGAAAREEREREQEEEERIERERLERLKLQAQRAQAAHASASGSSVPPESPVTPHTPSWGAPPPVPTHAHTVQPGPVQSPGDAADVTSMPRRPSLNALYIPNTPVHGSDLTAPVPAQPVEHELNLADLINIDEEPGQEVSISLASPAPSVPAPAPDNAAPMPMPGSPIQLPEGFGSLSPPPETPSTGLSPFASRSSYPDSTPRPSFDLNSIWTAPTGQDEAAGTSEAAEPQNHDEAMEIDSPDEPKAPSHAGAEVAGEDADDQDFDMFLGGGEEEAEVAPQPNTPEAQLAAFEALHKVWTGKLSMPLDSTIPQEVNVTARQIGGRKLEVGSPCWNVLFPAEHLRIDGRVPVDKSAQYLTQMRLNPTKELIAVAFSPISEGSAIAFDTLAKHLIAKGRHGLIFPWGNRPKEHHPGRELYIVPLLASDPIPDFLELLDELLLPTSRGMAYLIGIWVLNKGKLTTPPPSSTPPMLVDATPPIPAAGPSLPSGSSFSQLVPSAFQNPASNSGQPPNISTAALAAEVASLTPEQIQLMLRTLTGSSTVSSQPPPPPPPSVPAPQVQPWMSSPQNYPPPYPPAALPVLPNTQGLSIPPPPIPVPVPVSGYGSPGHFDRDAVRQPYAPNGGHQYDGFDRGGGGERGQRGRGRGSWNRGRGQGQGQGQGQGPAQSQAERQRDSGWRGRARARGQTNPTRGQWGSGSPPQWN